MDYETALQALRNMQNPTLADLKALLADVSVATPGAKATVLYSGYAGDVSARSIATALHDADSSLAIIDDTDAGRLILSGDFKDKLTTALGGDPNVVDSALYSGADSIWGQTSQRFVAGASGKIITIAPNPTNEGIFKTVEIEAAIKNPAVTAIDGIDRTALLADFNADGLDALAVKMADKSAGALYQHVATAGSDANRTIKVSEGFFAEQGISGIGALDTTNGQPVTRIAESVGAEALLAREASMVATGRWLAGLKAAGHLVGPAGDLISALVLADDVKTSLDAGDRAGAAQKINAFAGNYAGASISAGLAAELAAPLLLFGPIGWVGYLVVVAGAGYAGGKVGEKGVSALFDNVAGKVFGEDQSGLFEDIYRLGADGQLYVTRARRTANPDEIVFGDPTHTDPDEIVVIAHTNSPFEAYYATHNIPGVNDAKLIFDPELLSGAEEAFRAFLASGGTLTGGGGGSGDGSVSVSLPDIPALVANATPDGKVTINGKTLRVVATDPRNPGSAIVSVPTVIDDFGRTISVDEYYDAAADRFTKTGVVRVDDGDVQIRIEPGQPTTIKVRGAPGDVDFANAGSIIGSVFGNYLAGGDFLTGIVASAGLQTLGTNLGEILNAAVFGTDSGLVSDISQAFGNIGAEFLSNLQNAGVSAVTAVVTAEILGDLGVHGLTGRAVGSIANYEISTIANNLLSQLGSNPQAIFANIANLSKLSQVAGSFIGSTLANEFANWDEVGEQLGATIGGQLGGLIGQAAIPVPVLGAIIGSLVGDLIGGLIGGVFTGKPKSGAIVGYNQIEGFSVQNVWKDNGGQKAAARAIGGSAADALNGIVKAIGGELINGGDVDAGSYGLRGKSYIYWNDGTASDDRLTFDDATSLISYGVMKAASQFQFLGGDIYAKRAFYTTVAAGPTQTDVIVDRGPDENGTDQSETAINVDLGLDSLLGNLAVANRLETYLANKSAINALILAEPTSGFAADWLLALSHAADLGLLRRSAHDWDGGFSFLFKKADVDPRDVNFTYQLTNAQGNGERITYLGLTRMGDTIDTGSKTIIQGGTADDEFSAQAGGTRNGLDVNSPDHIANVFHGNEGNDTIRAGNSGDDVFGDAGDDVLIGGALDDWLFGGDGNDRLNAGGGNGNVLSGGNGNDVVVGSAGGSDWLAGDAGNDIVRGQAGDDYIDGGTGDDDLDGGEGSDVLIHREGDGADRARDSGKTAGDHDTVDFGAGISTADVEVLARSTSIDLSLVVNGSMADRVDLLGETLSPSQGFEEIRFTDVSWGKDDLAGRAVLAKTAGQSLAGTAANEVINGTKYDDNLSGGGGSDTLQGGFGSDTYHFNVGDGVVTIKDAGFTEDLDVLTFGAGITIANIMASHDIAAPQDIILTIGSNGDKVILPGQLLADGAHSIEEFRFQDGTSLTLSDLEAMVTAAPFTGGADYRLGFDANDTFEGGGGSDTLAGGLGDDLLIGGDGADTYLYNAGDGNDQIAEGYEGYLSTLVLGAGITPDEMRLSRDPVNTNDLVIRFANHAGSIVLQNQYYTDQNGIDTIQFADGTNWDRAAIDAAMLAQAQTGKADFIYAPQRNSSIQGGAGNDHIYGNSGSDTIAGGTGDDVIDGGTGADTYLYNVGDGNDQITEGYEGYTSTLVFGAGISASDIILERYAVNSNHLVIRFTDHPGSILLNNQYYGADRGIDIIQFADGTSWTHADLDAHMVAQASSSAGDIIYAGYNGNSINGGAGNDIIIGGTGSDTLIGGTGDDDLQGGSGADTYVYNLGDGNDRIVEPYEGFTSTLVLGTGITSSMLQFERDALNPDDLRVNFQGHDGSILVSGQYIAGTNRGLDVIQFADGSTLDRAAIETAGAAATVTNVAASGSVTINGSTGRDHIVGTNAAETILAGTGNDVMEGGNGDDTYVFNLGDGFDEIRESSGTDTIKFGPNILASDVAVSEFRDLDGTTGLMLSINGTTDRIYVYCDFSRGEGRIEQVKFDDGTTWTEVDLRAKAYTSAATTGDDLIAGSLLNDSINTGDGDDQVLDAGSGNDTLAGGKGNDYLAGGGDDDTFLFNLGDGSDTLDGGTGNDTLKFGAGINPDDIIITAETTSDASSVGLRLTIRGTSDSVFLVDDLNNGYRRIETIQFDNGTTWTDAQLRQKLMDAEVTDGSDFIEGSTLAETINGGSGEDHLLGSWGNDTLVGGKGNDFLDGGKDSDTFLFNRGDGIDTIADESGDNDTIRFGDGIAATDITMERYTSVDGSIGAILSVKGTQDKIYLSAVVNNGYRHIEHFQFADGSSWSMDQFFNLLNANVISGSTISSSMGDDVIVGSKGTDTLMGMGGDDVIRGGLGSDIYKFARGDGYDTYYDPTDPGATDKLVLTGVNSGEAKLLTSPTDADDAILYIDDDNIIYLDGQKTSATAGIDEIDFADGVVWHRADIDAKLAGGQGTSGADRIIGSLFADTLSGGAGNDTLLGGGGGDTYSYAVGDGDDVIEDDPMGSGSAQNVLSLGSGITQAELQLSRAADGAIVISFAAHAGSVTLRGDDIGGVSGVELVKFADGSSMTMAALRQANIAAQENGSSNVVTGFNSADTLAGGGGDDTLSGKGGADTYLFNLGDGSDTIVDGGDGKTNVLLFGAGISATSLRLSRTASAPNDLILTVPGGQGTVTLKDQMAGNGLGLEEIHFADGTIWHRGDLAALLLAQPATAGDDFLMGADAADTIDGLAGSDFIDGGAGNDVLKGGDGNDQLLGGAGTDSLTGGNGDDTVSGGTGVDTLDGGNGTDVVDYSFSLDSWSIDLAGGHASLLGGDAGSVEAITGFEGAIGGLGSDSITGTAGNDYLVGGAGEDTLLGAAGDDTFAVEDDDGAPDSINGGDGSDTILATADDVVIALKALSNVETISAGGHLNVSIQTTDDADVLDLGNVTLIGIQTLALGGGNDILTAPLTPVSVDAGSGNDTILYAGVHTGAGDTIDGGAGTDTIVAAANDTLIHLVTYQGIEAISAGAYTNVVLQRTDANEVMDLTGVTVTGAVKFDLAGGDDKFIGTAQADIVAGGLGNDTLVGGAGDDTYVFNAGDGQDLVQDTGGTDTLLLGAGITTADVSVFKADANNDFVLLFANNAGDRVTLDQAASTTNNHIEQVKFADGTIWTYNDIAAKSGGTLNVGTTGADTLHGTSGSEVIDGAAGNDILDGAAGNDTLIGGTGNDTVEGGGGDDTYLYNPGDGVDLLQDPSDYGGGQGGNDTLQLGQGIAVGDVTVTEANNGADLLLSFAAGGSVQMRNAVVDGNWTVEAVKFADGTAWSFAELMAHALTGGNGNDTLLGSYVNESIAGSAGNDMVDGRGGNDTLSGGAGNDTMEGGSGDDLYLYNLGDGTDVIQDPSDHQNGGQAGNDTLQFGAGITASNVVVSQANNGFDLVLTFSDGGSLKISREMVDGNWIVENIKFADGTVWAYADIMSHALAGTAGNDSLFGSSYLAESISGGAGNDLIDGRAGNDTLVGGTGNDTLEGGSDNDTYLYELGDGNDVVHDQSDYSGGQNGIDTVQFGVGIAPADITVTQSSTGYDVILSVAGGGSVTLVRDMVDYNWTIEAVKFADGTSWTYADVVAKAEAGTSGTDTIFGSTYNADSISGGAGDDTIDGRDGADTIIGGTGNDVLIGASGDDTYVYGLGDGDDTVIDQSPYGNGQYGTDTIKLGTGIAPGDVTVTKNYNNQNLVLTFAGSAGSITLLYTIPYAGYHIERVTFADGTVWTDTDLTTRAVADTILRGTAMADTINGTSATETLQGGAGSDSLSGGYGSDTYLYTSGDGNDTIFEQGSSGNDTDVLKLTGINQADVSLRTDGMHIWLKDVQTGYEIQIQYEFYQDGTKSAGLERIDFGDGTSWSRSQITQHAWLVGDAGANSINGSDADNTLQGKGGADYLAGGRGSDTYVYASGDGADTIYEQGLSPNETDVLKLTDLKQENVSLRTDGMHIWMKDKGTGSEIQIQYEFYQDGTNTAGLEEVDFSDGTIWSRAELMNRVVGTTVVSGASDESFAATASTDTYRFSGTFGHDTVSGFTTGGNTHDYLEVDRNQFSDWAHLLGATQQIGSDLVVALDANNSVTLSNVTLASFTQSNVKFMN